MKRENVKLTIINCKTEDDQSVILGGKNCWGIFMPLLSTEQDRRQETMEKNATRVHSRT